MSGGFVDLLARLRRSIAFTSYQSGLLYLIGRDDRGLHLHETVLPKPMGLAITVQGSLFVAGEFQIFRFENVLEPNQRANELFDACYAPRTVFTTGTLDAHDIGVDAEDQPIFVNTRFNCLARPSRRHSFEPVWRPPFISTLIDEDRCHLNGLAMTDGTPSYVTAVSRSDTIDGWRDRRKDGGVVVDVRRDEVLCDGLSMPHSPRQHESRLWLLNSGTGELGFVVPPSAGGAGRFEPTAFCPGFVRGLAFAGAYAFVGLSKPRYQRFEGLALDDRLRQADSEPWCGIQVIDIASGHCVEWFRIDGAVSEIFDVGLLPGIACPMAIAPDTRELARLITFPANATGLPSDGQRNP